MTKNEARKPAAGQSFVGWSLGFWASVGIGDFL
jgi:hypothetical protein